VGHRRLVGAHAPQPALVLAAAAAASMLPCLLLLRCLKLSVGADLFLAAGAAPLLKIIRKCSSVHNLEETNREK
jgi:hypothetical protein